jgi:SAM-dependent methyltransferase
MSSHAIDAEISAFRQRVFTNKFIPLPPPHRNQSVPADFNFLESGVDVMCQLIVEGVRPHSHLLDIGCGIGRLALPATQFLSPEGRYFGLDINLSAVAWCHENITQRYTNFRFATINAKNVHYGHTAEYGQQPLERSQIPIAGDRRFDAVVMVSVFTHLLWREVDIYLSLLSSLLGPGGFAYTTWFLIDDIARSNIAAGKSRLDFDLDASTGPTFLMKGSAYSRAIAHDESVVIETAAKHGLTLKRAPHHSRWDAGQPKQDILVFTAAS